MASNIEDTSPRPNKLTNLNVIDLLKEKGCSETALLLVDLYKPKTDAPNNTEHCYSDSVKTVQKSLGRLKSRHLLLNKSSFKEKRNGTAGNEGTYDYWASQTYSYPVSAHTEPSTSTQTLAMPMTDPSITRAESIDIRAKLDTSQKKTSCRKG